MSDGLKILLVDDDAEDQLITRRLIERGFGKDVIFDWLSSWNDAAQEIRAQNHDVYLVDYSLGKNNGIDLLHEVGNGSRTAPILMLTGSDDHSVDLAAQAAGAADYLVKSELTSPLLERAIRYAIERKRVERDLIRLAHFDSLTGLLNRTQFRAELESSIRHSGRGSEALAVLLLDLDHFKEVNDTLGHPAGDLLLKEVAARLRSVVRDTDTVARLGGDEFVIIATHLNHAMDASTLAQKIIDSLSKPVSVEGHELFVRTSIGITLCPRDADQPDDVLRNADLALYKAKEEGRGQFCFFEEQLNVASQQRKSIESELRSALELSSFRLCYQPRIDLVTGQLAGVEALVRWRRDDGCWAVPDTFIPAAEASGLIVPLGEWILREACQQQREWQRSGGFTGPISVNLSAIQLRRDEFARRLVSIIDDSGVDPCAIELEMTESAVMGPDDAPVRRLRMLSERGVRLAIDDFGTGYSSLSRLKQLPVDTLKIGRSFVGNVEKNKDDAAIVESIIQLGSSLGLCVVGLGVENAAQVAFLRERNCAQVQGFFYSAALDSTALVRWAEAFGRTDPIDIERTANTGYPDSRTLRGANQAR